MLSTDKVNVTRRMGKNKKAQEEMVGFALIIILVSIILLVFLAFSLKKDVKSDVESYEVSSFLQSTLQYTTACVGVNLEFRTVQDLIFDCSDSSKCADERDSCQVLNDTLKGILKESWPVSEGASSYKGYELKILTGEEGQRTEILAIRDSLEGKNLTGSYKGASQPFSRGASYDIEFKVYYG